MGHHGSNKIPKVRSLSFSKSGSASYISELNTILRTCFFFFFVFVFSFCFRWLVKKLMALEVRGLRWPQALQGLQHMRTAEVQAWVHLWLPQKATMKSPVGRGISLVFGIPFRNANKSCFDVFCLSFALKRRCCRCGSRLQPVAIR